MLLSFPCAHFRPTEPPLHHSIPHVPVLGFYGVIPVSFWLIGRNSAAYKSA